MICQPGVIVGHGIGGDHQAVVFPGVLRLVAGSAFVAAGEGIADGDAEFIFDDGDGVEIGNEGAAIVAVKVGGLLTTPYICFMARVIPAML